MSQEYCKFCGSSITCPDPKNHPDTWVDDTDGDGCDNPTNIHSPAVENNGMDDIERRAYEIYQRSGQDAVMRYADTLTLPYVYCEPCEIDSPVYKGACLVCGTITDTNKLHGE